MIVFLSVERENCISETMHVCWIQLEPSLFGSRIPKTAFEWTMFWSALLWPRCTSNQLWLGSRIEGVWASNFWSSRQAAGHCSESIGWSGDTGWAAPASSTYTPFSAPLGLKPQPPAHVFWGHLCFHAQLPSKVRMDGRMAKPRFSLGWDQPATSHAHRKAYLWCGCEGGFLRASALEFQCWWTP